MMGFVASPQQLRVGSECDGSIGRIIRKFREAYRSIRQHGVGEAGTLISKKYLERP